MRMFFSRLVTALRGSAVALVICLGTNGFGSGELFSSTQPVWWRSLSLGELLVLAEHKR
jgi:hypothetical protein